MWPGVPLADYDAGRTIGALLTVPPTDENATNVTHPPLTEHGGSARRLLAAALVAWLLTATLGVHAARAVDTDMTISTTSVDFGQVNVGGQNSVSVTLTNTGGDPFGPINMFGGAPPTAEFNASQNCQAVTLAPGAFCSINYTFGPGTAGSFTDVSSFTLSETASQSDGEDFSVTLTGVAIDPNATPTPSPTPEPTPAPTLAPSAPPPNPSAAVVAPAPTVTPSATASAEDSDEDDDGLFGGLSGIVLGAALGVAAVSLILLFRQRRTGDR